MQLCSKLASPPLAGSIAVRVAETPPPTTEGWAIYVAGLDRSAFTQPDSITVSEELNMRGDCRFRLVDETGVLHVDIGQTVEFWLDGVKIFAGTIDSYDEHTPDNTSAIFIDVSAVDYTQLLDRHIVNYIYPAGQTLWDVVTNLVDVQSGDPGETLANDGITYTSDTVQVGPTLQRIVLKNKKCSDALDKLCELVGYTWWVDYDRVLYVQDSSSNYAPAPLDVTLNQHFGNVRFSATREDYRNIQILEAGKTTTQPVWDADGNPISTPQPRQQTWKGDGETRTFTVDLPLAGPPRLWVDAAEVDQADIAIREQDDEAKWFYALDSEIISQNSDEAALSASEVLKAWYQGYFPITQIARADPEIDARRAVEGGTGVYVHIENDDDIDDDDLAREYSDALLRRHGSIPFTVKTRTTTHGYHAGQLVPVALAEHRTTAEYLIESVTWRWLGWDEAQPFTYEITAIYPESQGSWADFFKRLAEKGRPFTIAENETIQAIRHWQEILTVSDDLTLTDGDAVPDWELDPYTRWVYGLSRIGRTCADNYVLGPLFGAPYEP